MSSSLDRDTRATAGTHETGTRVAVVDDDEAVRATLVALCRSVGLEAVAFADLGELEQGLDRDARGCLLLDLRLPDLSGIPAIERAVARFPQLAVISISAHADARTVVRALRAGAVDFFDKPFSNQELLEAVQLAVAGRGQERVQSLSGASTEEVALLMRSLTRKQRAVVELFAAGASEPEIAERLSLHLRSVQRHLQNALDKLNLTDADRTILSAATSRDRNF